MKISALILSFYFLSLNFFGCDDAPKNFGLDDEIVTEIIQGNDGHNNSSGDLCPPFCHCHCCHVHLVEFPLADITVFNPEISSVIVSGFEGPERNYFSSILQPPRI